jgi:hypothetical protein
LYLFFFKKKKRADGVLLFAPNEFVFLIPEIAVVFGPKRKKNSLKLNKSDMYFYFGRFIFSIIDRKHLMNKG